MAANGKRGTAIDAAAIPLEGLKVEQLKAHRPVDGLRII